ncbi:MAG: prepilin-type N-terminal cleavage/methylation domain-containing protein [Azoarcus sp.]|jgi:MSHA biogenesis protein MshO|nr:prepilin-type N-terminal cleavage/methylation domain-containing protein [Azoarcus sp.]
MARELGEMTMATMKTGRGFSLMELIVVIMVMAILGGSALVFFRPALDSYFDSRRRAELTDMADVALRRMGREVRAAVPNSVQTHGTACFRFVRTVGGGRYRKLEDMTRSGSKALDLTQAAPEFDVLSPLQPAVGDWVVIGNQTGSDVYAGHNRATITGSSAVDSSLGTTRLSMGSMNGTYAPFSYMDGRFVLTPRTNPVVTYVCSGAGLNAAGTGTGTLKRIAGDFDGGGTLAACPSGGDLLAWHVSACRFVYDPNMGATQQSGFVWMELELAEANEKVRLTSGAHVINLP